MGDLAPGMSAVGWRARRHRSMRRSQSAVELRSTNSLARHCSASDLTHLDQVPSARHPSQPARFAIQTPHKRPGHGPCALH
jgi:hypothetical protein